MKTLNNLKMKIMVRAFRIRIKNGENIEDIAADYPALTVDDLEAIKEVLNTNQQEQPSWRMMQNATWWWRHIKSQEAGTAPGRLILENISFCCIMVAEGENE